MCFLHVFEYIFSIHISHIECSSHNIKIHNSYNSKNKLKLQEITFCFIVTLNKKLFDPFTRYYIFENVKYNSCLMASAAMRRFILAAQFVPLNFKLYMRMEII